MAIIYQNVSTWPQRAIFGGHISGRRLRGVKFNPIFHDNDRYFSAVSPPSDFYSDGGAPHAASLEVDVYESLPRPAHNFRLRHHHAHSDPELLDLDHAAHDDLSMAKTWSLRRPEIFDGPVHNEAAEAGTAAMKIQEHQDSHSGSGAKDSSGVEPTNAVSVIEPGDVHVHVSSAMMLAKKVPEIEVKEAVMDALSEGPSEASDSGMVQVSQDKDHIEVVPTGEGTPIRRVSSNSSMIVYEDVADDDSFPVFATVISHLCDTNEDQSEMNVQENMLCYTSDSDSPTNALMSAPSANTDSDWPNMDELTLPSDSEEHPDAYPESPEKMLPKPVPPPSSKPVKPILLSTTSHDESIQPPVNSNNLSPSEQKTVTFAKGTVFNDDKPKRYVKEKINLKELYHDRVCGRTGVGMVNPVFVISDKKLLVAAEGAENCLTDDEKAKRHSFRINLLSNRSSGVDNVPPGVGSDNSLPRVPDLNTPAYLQKYLEQATTNSTEQNASGETTLTFPPEENEMNDINVSTEIILDMAPDSLSRMDRKMLVRRRLICWSVFTVVLLVFIAAAVGLGIYFTNLSNKDRSNITTVGSVS